MSVCAVCGGVPRTVEEQGEDAWNYFDGDKLCNSCASWAHKKGLRVFLRPQACFYVEQTKRVRDWGMPG